MLLSTNTLGFFAALGGLTLLVAVLTDAFATMILPRRVTESIRLTRLFYRLSWRAWSTTARLFRGAGRENFLSIYGPWSLLCLVVIWALTLVTGFALLQWAAGSHLKVPEGAIAATFSTDLYMSGTTFFTLGLGDITPTTAMARFLTVLEGGTGFGFLALVIGYIPVLYQSFSRREASISLLDARAGSPPSAAEMIRRLRIDQDPEGMLQVLRDWERWCAELLESHLSYPVLAYYRSQHDQQSWLGALATVLDLSAIVMVGESGALATAGRLTFAIARHAAVDLSQVFNTRPHQVAHERLPRNDRTALCALLQQGGLDIHTGDRAEQRLQEFRDMYEPYLGALAEYLLIPLPGWLPATDAADDWQTSAWEHGPIRPLAATDIAPTARRTITAPAERGEPHDGQPRR